MFYVYVLLNNEGRIYIGYSKKLDERIKDHASGRVEYTKHKRPWKLVYYEAYSSQHDARVRERTLKHYGSTLGQLKQRIQNSLRKT